MVSLPVWERGLKLLQIFHIGEHVTSLPVWERGLKHQKGSFYLLMLHVAPRVGAWIETKSAFASATSWRVAPRVGAWIETNYINGMWEERKSLPVWERGLKPMPVKVLETASLVAPRVGAWIETVISNFINQIIEVAPRVGAWIETSNDSSIVNSIKSLPVWERGLKLLDIIIIFK